MQSKTKICIEEDCENKVHARGLCGKHYYHWLKDNNPRDTRNNLICMDCDGNFRVEAYKGPIPKRCGECTTKYWAKCQRRWANDNREQVRASISRCSKNNKSRRRRNAAKRRALKANSPVVQNIDLELLYDVFNGCCYLCGYEVEQDEWDLEHIVPLSKGGSHSYSNLAVSCPPCNSKKGPKQLWEVN